MSFITIEPKEDKDIKPKYPGVYTAEAGCGKHLLIPNEDGSFTRIFKDGSTNHTNMIFFNEKVEKMVKVTGITVKEVS